VPFEGGGYFDLTPVDIATDFRKRVIEFLEQLGVPVKGSYHEAGPSQQEVVLKHTDALTAADAILTFRMAIKQAAYGLNTFGSFMPKPLEDQPGSGMHLHLSLFDEKGENLFHDPEQPGQLSPLGRRFTAGVLRHAAEMTAVTNQWVNSYKRLADGFEAPAAISWSHKHPNPLIRVPNLRPNHPDAARIELRSPDSASNPYLVLALALAAGLRGIEEAYDLPPETEDFDEGKPRLPHDLREATDLLESSAFARDALGSRIVDWVVANKRREWDAYSRTVSDFERRTYLQAL
jgi:glutamine synthetase